MFNFCLNLVLIILSLLGHTQTSYAQHFYEPQMYESIEEDPEYKAILTKIEKNNEVFYHMWDSLLCSPINDRSLIDSIVIDLSLFSLLNDSSLVKINQEKKNVVWKRCQNVFLNKRRFSNSKRVLEHQYSCYKEFDSKGEIIFTPNELVQLNRLGLKDSIRILDIGGGDGLAAIKLSRLVSNSQIYVSELRNYSLNKLSYNWKFHPQVQVSKRENGNDFFVVKGDTISTATGSLKFDLIWIEQTLHHFSHPVEMLLSVNRALKKGGKLFIIEDLKNKSKMECKKALKRKKVEKLLRDANFDFTIEKFIDYNSLSMHGFLAIKKAEE